MSDDVPPAPIPLWVQRLLLPYVSPSEPDDPTRQAKTATVIRWHEAGFAETSNPLHAWFAYHHARAVGLDVPEWVSAYLDAAAAKIWELALQPPLLTQREAAELIAAALGLTRLRRGTVLSDFPWGDATHDDVTRDDTTQIELAAWTYAWSRDHGKPYLAWEHVATKFGVDRPTVRRAWAKYQHLFELPAPAPGSNPQDK